MSDVSSLNSSFVQNTLNPMTSSSQTGSLISPSSAPGNNSGDLLRITGMASGLNVDQMVSQLVAPYQMQIDKVQQDMQTIQFKQQMYSNIIDDVKSFQNTYFNVTNPDTNIASFSFFNSLTASSSDTNSVSVTATASATQGNYSISVNSLAQAASLKGNSLNCQVQISNNDITNWSGKKIDFNIGGSTTAQISLDALTSTGNANQDCAALVNNINKQLSQNSSLSGKISASYIIDGNNSYIKFSNTSGTTAQITGSDISDINSSAAASYNLSTPVNIINPSTSSTLSQIGFSGTGSLNLNLNNANFSISVTEGETIGQFMQDISSKTSGQVIGKMDDLTGSFSLTTSKTGSSSVLTVTNSTSDPLLKALGMNSLPVDANGNIIPSSGKDASVTITEPGGNATTISESSNNFSLDGVNFNIKNVTNLPVNVAVSSNPDTVVNKFKGFMDKYNGIINEINTKINEKTSFNYPPLTNSQKSQMSSADIQAWNVKAQEGLLHDDDNLTNMLSELKNTFYDSIQGAVSSFGSKMGVDFSTDFSHDGTIVFTDGTGDAFKQALQTPSCDVVNLFTKSAGTLTGTDKYNNEGIFQRINDTLNKYAGITGVTSNNSILGKMVYKQDNYSVTGQSSSNTFLDQLFDDSNKIKDLQQKYSDKRTQYYQQFSTLEQAMNQLNSQSASLIQQMSGG